MDFQTFVSEVDRDFKNTWRIWDMQYVQTVRTLILSGFTLYVGPVNDAQVFAQWNDVYIYIYLHMKQNQDWQLQDSGSQEIHQNKFLTPKLSSNLTNYALHTWEMVELRSCFLLTQDVYVSSECVHMIMCTSDKMKLVLAVCWKWV